MTEVQNIKMKIDSIDAAIDQLRNNFKISDHTRAMKINELNALAAKYEEKIETLSSEKR